MIHETIDLILAGLTVTDLSSEEALRVQCIGARAPVE